MLLDTNILVRHLTGEPNAQAKRATRFLAEAERLVLPSLIVAELVHVLESVYDTPRPAICAAVRAVLAHPPITADEHDVILRTVELYETTPLHFADAYLAARAEASDGQVASLDRALDRLKTITRVSP